jgi:predicted TIM-barrel fold metal-dependent hydrolase
LQDQPAASEKVVLVAMHEPKEAGKELERCVKELGFVAVAASTQSPDAKI